eukprot:UN07556
MIELSHYFNNNRLDGMEIRNNTD